MRSIIVPLELTVRLVADAEADGLLRLVYFSVDALLCCLGVSSKVTDCIRPELPEYCCNILEVRRIFEPCSKDA
jgi:hypothetical protein